MNTTHHRTGIALALVLILSWACLAQGPSETEAAQAVADDAQYAASLAAADNTMEAALQADGAQAIYTAAQADGGKAHCAALGRLPKWTPDGDLVCRLPKAERPVLQARL